MPADQRRSARGELRARGRELVWGRRTYVMAIVNVTPDSFSGDGRPDVADAVRFAVQQHERTADLIDIGGQSTRPGHVPIPAHVETARVVPVIERVRAALPGAIISVDTYEPGVLRAALVAGADMLNCIAGMPAQLLDVAAQAQIPVAIMHNKAQPHYDGDVVDEVLGFLEEAASRAVRAQIRPNHVLLDPGIGFGKTADHNIAVLHNLRRLVALGFPSMLGTSRKSTIGKLTGREPADRLFGTAATTALAVAAGIDVVRVHDVAETRDVVNVADAIVRGWRPANWT